MVISTYKPFHFSQILKRLYLPFSHSFRRNEKQ
jgi:hypothetical protein